MIVSVMKVKLFMQIKFTPIIIDSPNKNVNNYRLTNSNPSYINLTIQPASRKNIISFNGNSNYSKNEIKYVNFAEKISSNELKFARIKNKLGYKGKLNFSTIIPMIQYLRLSPRINKMEILNTLYGIQKNGIADKKLQDSLSQLIAYYEEMSSTKKKEPTIIERELKKKERVLRTALSESQITIDGEKYSNVKLIQKLISEKDSKMRKKIYKASKTAFGDEKINEFRDLIIKRNEFAREHGYENYFNYISEKKYKINSESLSDMLLALEKTTDEIYEKIANKEHQKLADIFGISKEELQPWHYDYIPEDNTFSEIEKYLTKENSASAIVKDMFKEMGWDISKSPIKIDARKKGVRIADGCACIEPNREVRISASIGNDMRTITTLSHELGHAVYDIGFDDKLQFFQKTHSSVAMTEAIALLFGSLPEKELIFNKIDTVPATFTSKIKSDYDERSVKILRLQLLRSSFEKEIYNNPNQNFGELWYKLENKFLKTNIPQEIDNAWSSIPHFITSPGYYQNYIRAQVIKDQIYETAYKELGPLTQSKKTAEYFKEKIFKYGASLTDDEIIKRLTNKPINLDAICNSLKKIRL